MNNLSSILIYVGLGLVFLSALVFIVPYIQNFIKSKRKDTSSLNNTEINDSDPVEKKQIMEIDSSLDCEEPNGVKINICADSALTEEDEKLRNILFEKHIKNYNPNASLLHDGKIPIPFESIVFLTKNHSPIVNEDGQIIITLNKSDSGLVVEEKEKATFEKTKKEETIKEDVLNEISKPSSEELIVDNTKVDKKEKIKENAALAEEENQEARKKAPPPPASDDGFLTTFKKTNESSFIKKVDGDSMNDLMAQTMEDIGDSVDDSEFDIDPYEEDDNEDMFSDEDLNLEEETEGDQENNTESKVKDLEEEEEFDYSNSTAVEIEADQDLKLPSSKSEAIAMYEAEFVETSLSLVDKNCIIGSTVDLDDALDAMDDNLENCQEVFVRNLFAINGVGITTPDKIIMLPRFAIAKAASITLTQMSGVQTAIYKHLKSKNSMKDTLNMIRFIISNPEFTISDPSSPFEFLAFEQENGEYCKDNVIRISSVFIEEIFGSLGSVIMKYPPKVIKVTSTKAEKFCEH